MTSDTWARRSARARGFSLLEVLIALIIMSVGMLGIAGLYVHSMQAGRTSIFRHHAVMLAGDVADRIRANPRGGAVYTVQGGADNNCVAKGKNCDASEMAANDVFLWEEQAANLPAGDVTVAYNNAAVPSVYTVTVTWSEPSVKPGDPNPQYQITFPVFEM